MKRQCALILSFLCFSNVACSADLGSSSDSDEEAAEHVQADSGVTYTSNRSLYGNLSFLLAPFVSLDDPGFRFRIGGLTGQYSYLTEEAPLERIHGNGQSADVMIGYSFKISETVKLFAVAGIVYQNNTNSRVDPNNPVHGADLGVKTLVELDMNPTKQTVIQVQGTFSTVHDGYYVQVQTGYAFLGAEKYFGPELILLGDDFFNQWRLGGSLTGLKVGTVELGFSGGYVRDRTQGSGGYAGIDVGLRF